MIKDMNTFGTQQPPDELLISSIISEAESKAAEIIDRAEKEARSIIAKANKEAELKKQEALKKAASEAESIKRRLLSGVHLEIKQRLLKERESLINRVIESLLKKLDKLRSHEDYGEVLREFILEGATALDTDEVIVCGSSAEKKILNASMLRKIEKYVKDKVKKDVSLKFSENSAKEGGILLRTVSGDRSFDNRFPARIERILPDLRLEIVRSFEDELGSDFVFYGKSGDKSLV